MTAAGPFKMAARTYRAAGWLGVIPLPEHRKSPPPTGYTGNHARYPDDGQVNAWLANPALSHANIGVRLGEIDGDAAHEIVGIDVDHYRSGDRTKVGGDQFRELETALGLLPSTWISSARSDGVSGIRFYRAPAGLEWKGKAANDIEIIQRKHRFAVVWPSIHPEGTCYQLYPPGCEPNGTSFRNAVPDATTLPALPDAWIDRLTARRTPAADHPIDIGIAVDDLYCWAESAFNNGNADAMCKQVRKQTEQHCLAIRSEATSHDKITAAHWNLYSLAAEGHTGWQAAINTIEHTYRHDVIERGKRGLGELRGEVIRSRIGALRRVKCIVAQAADIGARYTPPLCTCTEGPAISRFSYTPHHNFNYRLRRFSYSAQGHIPR
ncbi:MAG: bifunctional DNA primase/polymerase [Mycobacterium sp.]|nr:bifunctional DNA primase/polymerase [Mycobacterium sp.]